MGPPVFPQEVFDLILSHVQHLEDIPFSYATALHAESAQRELGYRMQRVCSAWVIGGRRIAWSRFTYFWNADDHLINGLLERPNLAGEIRELFYERSPTSGPRGPPASIRRRRDATLKVVELIEMCSARLETLFFDCPEDNLDLWAQVSSSVMASTIRKLGLVAHVNNEADLFILVRSLGEFVLLNGLFINIYSSREWPTSTAQTTIRPAPTTSRLPVARFTLQQPFSNASGPSISPADLFASLLNPEQLQTLELDISARDMQNLDWVGAFRRLEFISLSVLDLSRGGLTTRLSFLVDTLSTLPVLKTVFIEPSPAGETPHGIALEPSPVSLGRLLMRMPPSIGFYRLGGGVFFVDDVGLPLVSLRVRPSPQVSLKLSLKLKGTEKARPVELSRRTDTNGVKLWSIVL